MRHTRTTFIGGTSGSGKTHMTSTLVERHPQVLHVTASQLLADKAASNSRVIVSGNGHALDLQDTLVERFTPIRASFEGPIVLDGHYLIPTRHEPFAVPSEVFELLEIDSFILVRASPELIFARLRSRIDSTWWDGTLESIEALIEMETAHAYSVATSLGRPLTVIDPNSETAQRSLWSVIADAASD